MVVALEPFAAFPGGEKGLLFMFYGFYTATFQENRHRGPGNHFLPII